MSARINRPVLALALAICASPTAWAAEKDGAPAASAPEPLKPAAPGLGDTPDGAGEDVDVQNIKKKYWATGDEAEMGVVQNRLFSKANKFELGVSGGAAFSDPFLSLRPFGGYFGYNFNEFWGVDALAWKIASNPSSALGYLQSNLHADANTNNLNEYYGSEVTGNFLYGKLSLLGKAIIYYDMYFSAGGGVMDSETGNYLTESVGVGQRFYINRWMSLKFDYRLMHFNENLVQKEITTELGQPAGSRSNFMHTLMFSFEFMFGKGTAK